MGGMLIFAIGFFLSLYATGSKGSFRPFFTFLALFFSVWMLLVVPTAQIEMPSSTMEKNGYKEMNTQEFLQEKGYSNYVVNPILNIFSDMFSAFTIGCVKVIERGADIGDPVGREVDDGGGARKWFEGLTHGVVIRLTWTILLL